ncbi:hypothetical protein [Paenibacillus illinoisensis]|uniref:hypothetical protein n=1 Tax=Paenibacillus illinoisensis TaxID=59845 RepID=UPI000FDB15AA|nr:hypothetical protein [Paenibacillus illinoisensis]
MFTKEAYLVQITTEGLKKYVSLLPMVAISTGIIGFLSLTGFPKFAAIINVLRQTIILYTCVTLLPMWIGMSGLWLAQPITDFVTALICIGILLKLFGKKMVRNGVVMESKQS